EHQGIVAGGQVVNDGGLFAAECGVAEDALQDFQRAGMLGDGHGPRIPAAPRPGPSGKRARTGRKAPLAGQSAAGRREWPPCRLIPGAGAPKSMNTMKPATPPSSDAPRRARRAIDGAMARDRGRLIGLWSKWNAEPASAGARERFEQALRASVAEREDRAGRLPQAQVDTSLPIAAHAERLVELIREHQVVVVAGQTGPGKTTQLPKLCLAAGRGAAGMIGCTQPRRIAARAVARRVAEELGVLVGDAVGFQVRFTAQVG